MHIEDVRVSTGEVGRDFVIPGRSVPEIFSARLMNGTNTLEVTWTESLGQGTLVNRIAKAEELAGGPGTFNRIIGYASDHFREFIQAGRFNAQEFAQSLSRRLGGTWRVDVTPRPKTNPPTWNVTATRLGE
jgi:hypothetical protein